MDKIETQDGLMAWAKAVNRVGTYNSLHDMCDLQDVFARSEVKTLKALFIGSGQNQKEALVFSIQKAMGSAALFDFIKSYYNHRAQDIIDADSEAAADRWEAALSRERLLDERERHLSATIENLRTQNEALKKGNDSMKEQIIDYYKRNHNLEMEIETLAAENKRLGAFEAHIKEMLTD